MRLRSIFKHALVASVAIFSLQSCDNDDDYDYSLMFPNALVTVKTDANDTFFLQLDDETTLLPVNVTKSPFGEKEVRALVNFEETTDPSEGFSKAVHINWIDSILTKPIAANLGEEENNNVYGNDPVEIMNSWMTVSEDGYLTLRFNTAWGNTGTKHFVNLISTNNPENPYEVEFRHNAYGDTYGHPADGLVAFKLDGILPDTEGETVKLKLIWNSYSGEKSHEFDYCTRQSTPANPEMTSVRAKNFIN